MRPHSQPGGRGPRQRTNGPREKTDKNEYKNISIRSMFKDNLWFFKENKLRLLLLFLLTSALSMILIVEPLIFASFVERVENGSLTKRTLIIIFISQVAAVVFMYGVAASKNATNSKLEIELGYQMKDRYLNKVLNQDGEFFETYQSGDLLSRVNMDISTVKSFILRTPMWVYSSLLTIVFALIILLGISVKLTLYIMIPLPFLIIIVKVFQNILQNAWREVSESNADLNNHLMDYISEIKLVRSFSQEDKFEKNAIDGAEKMRKKLNNSTFINIFPSTAFNLLVQAVTLITYIVGVGLIAKQASLSVNDFVRFTLISGSLIYPAINLGELVNQINAAKPSYKRLIEIQNASDSSMDLNSKTVNNEFRITKIEYKDLSFKFPKDNFYTLKNINLVINNGDTIGIAGKTGSGKSALVRQLLRNYTITSGELLINNENISNIDKTTFLKRIAYVPQEHIVFSRTIKKNIELGSNAFADDNDISLAVALADFQKDIDFLPHGLETVVGEKGASLSGGQQQRLSISRALIRDADVLILDDSLSAVDGKTEKNIVENLNNSRKDKINLIVSHRLSVLQNATKIIIVSNGEIVDVGTHEELMCKEDWYKEQFLLQQLDEGDVNE